MLLDAAVGLLFLAVACWLGHGLWPDPATRVLALNPADQTLYEWFLAHGSRVLSGDLPLVTDRLNHPEGVNLLANTSVIALAVLFAPVTAIAGAPVSFALLLIVNLAGTATAWYLLYARVLRARRGAALLGGALCGFGPGMLSQSNSHLHMTAQWLVPVLVGCVVRMLRAAEHGPRRAVFTSAAALAAVVSCQVFIGEEVLFLSALTLALLSLGYALSRPRHALRVLPGFLLGLLTAAGLAAAVLAVPLRVQFSGRQSVTGSPFNLDFFFADLASWVTASPLSMAGTERSARLASGPGEYTTFLGWPLLLVAAACAVALVVVPVRGGARRWRRSFAVACVLAGGLLAAVGLGRHITLDGEDTGLTGPYQLVAHLPVVDAALPTRFALPVLPLIAALLVLALDEFYPAVAGLLADPARPPRWRAEPGWSRWRGELSWWLSWVLVPLALFVAAIPIAPAPLPTVDRAPVPAFFTTGHWRDWVPPGGVLVPAPPPSPGDPEAMRWAASTGADFALPEGFFIGPYGGDGRASMGVGRLATSALLAKVAEEGQLPVISEAERAQARRDLAYWGASCVVLAAHPQGELLYATLTALLGPGTQVDDVWVWRV